ncbi:hypothetical protein [Microbacterium sp. W4I20]|uniref:hypothetical protein n=1 Tax=Microbacterium sp. W4I20 TaxID=3042262 RepID=UPI0027872F06|nr:hypothetical protein [Microbacterium sp. W4I20]MDQ0729160.1 hypothetical protein [Microbacterium sp. W4I20]
MPEDTAATTHAAILRSTAAGYRSKAAAGAVVADIGMFLTAASLLEGRAKRIAAGENDFSTVSLAGVENELG